MTELKGEAQDKKIVLKLTSCACLSLFDCIFSSLHVLGYLMIFVDRVPAAARLNPFFRTGPSDYRSSIFFLTH